MTPIHNAHNNKPQLHPLTQSIHLKNKRKPSTTTSIRGANRNTDSVHQFRQYSFVSYDMLDG